MTKLFIPSIGDKIKLTSDWSFPCFTEYRNHKFLEAFRPDVKLPEQRWNYTSLQTVVITLPKDTVLRVDRIYIRKGNKEWDSVTFVVASHPTLTTKAKGFAKHGRFWAKLVDVNEIEFEPYTEPPVEEKPKCSRKTKA